MPYAVTDKQTRLALAFGEAAVHNQNGKLIRHEAIAVGSDLQIKLQSALGVGEWESCEKLTYDGVDIPPQNFEFYGGGSLAGQSALFPTDIAHTGAAMINVNLPVGMAQDNQPDKLVGRYKTSRTADYTAAGAQTAFAYSPSPARAAVHAIKLLTGDTSLVEFGAFDEYKAWCAETITITKDGVAARIPRFELNAFFIPPFTLKQVLDRICALTCSDWQWQNGKIRLIPAVDRTAGFNFDASKVARDFKFQSLPRKSRPNGVRVLWRDFDNALLKEADPVVVKRANLIALDDGIENFYEFNASVCRKSQAERVANYLARTKCDLLDFAQVTGSFKSYVVLPGDLVTLSHTTPDWTNKPCKVIKKTEDEDRGAGYQHYLQLQPSNPYSDADQTALTTRTATAGSNPYAAPPLPVLTLQQDSGLEANGSTTNSIVGTIGFGTFGFRQTAKVYWQKPGGALELLADLTPDAGNAATFRAVNPPSGVNFFKVVPVSELNVSNANVSTANQKSITVAPNTFYVDGIPVSVGLFRATSGLDAQGRYIGRDTTVIPTDAIRARIDSADIIGENVWCVVVVEIVDLFAALAGGTTKPAHNQSDTADLAQVDVFNQFGALAKEFPPAAVKMGKGAAVTSFPRKYADPFRGHPLTNGAQCFFRIKIFNRFGWSKVVYLSNGFLSPTLPGEIVSPEAVARELSAAAISANDIQITFQFSGTTALFRRVLGTTEFIQHAGGITASPYTATGFSESTDYELRLSGSNIVRVRTPAAAPVPPPAGSPPVRSAPSALSGAPDAANPTTQINAVWTRSAADNLNVEVWKDNVLLNTLPGAQTTYNFTALAPGTTCTFKVRNKWSATDFSPFSNEFTATAQAAPAGTQPPEITSANYDTTSGRIQFGFTPKGGAGNYQSEYSVDSAPFVVSSSSIPASAAASDIPVAQGFSVEKFVDVRIKRTDVTGYSNVFRVIVPVRHIRNPREEEGCFAPETGFDLSFDRSIPFAELYRRRKEFIGGDVLSFDALNRYTQRRLLHVFRVKSNTFAVARFGNGLKRKMTPNHRFWTENKEFVSICRLKKGAKVYDKNWNLIEIESVKIKTVKIPQWFYNATVETDHAYFVGFAVSNIKPRPTQ